jgi:hypothetical protein
MQNPPHGVVAGFPSMITAQSSKKLFQQIIGALGLDGYFSERGIDIDGICKQPFIILVDLFGQLLAKQISFVTGVFIKFRTESADGFFDTVHGFVRSFIIQTVPSGRLGNTHFSPEIIKEYGPPFKIVNRPVEIRITTEIIRQIILKH